jgi:hypothetical protein
VTPPAQPASSGDEKDEYLKTVKVDKDGGSFDVKLCTLCGAVRVAPEDSAFKAWKAYVRSKV